MFVLFFDEQPESFVQHELSRLIRFHQSLESHQYTRASFFGSLTFYLELNALGQTCQSDLLS